MEKKQTQKLHRISLFGGLIFALLVLFVVIVDPFYHYHKPIWGMTTYLYNEVYQTPGVARNFEYSDILLGTSMTENFRTDWFDDAFGMNMVKLCYAGARTSDLDAVLEQVFLSENEINTVFMDLNAYQLEVPSDTAYVERPEYLYDSNIFNDLKYVCNFDTLSTAAGFVFATLGGREDNMATAYMWDDPEAFGKDKVMEVAYATRKEYLNPELQEQDISDAMVNCRRNLENIGKHIVKHPETKFVILYPPYNIMFWDDANPEKRDLCFDMLQMALEYFGDMPNAEQYFFMDDYEVITNFEVYRDLGHYTPEINYRMFQDLAAGNYKVTKDQGIERLEALRQFVNNYDFEALWKEYEGK